MHYGQISETKKAGSFLTLPPFQDNHLRNFKLTHYQLLEGSKDNPGGTRVLILPLNSSIRIPFRNLHCIEFPTVL